MADRYFRHRFAAVDIEIECRVEGTGQGNGIAWLDQEPGLTLKNGFLGAAMIEGNDRAAHRLGLSGDTGKGGLVQAVRLANGERDLAVQQRVVRLVDAFFAALAEELADPVTVVGERGLGRCR